MKRKKQKSIYKVWVGTNLFEQQYLGFFACSEKKLKKYLFKYLQDISIVNDLSYFEKIIKVIRITNEKNIVDYFLKNTKNFFYNGFIENDKKTYISSVHQLEREFEKILNEFPVRNSESQMNFNTLLT